MSDNMVKIAKHEALMVGNPSSAHPPAPPQAPTASSISTTAKFAVTTEDLQEHSPSSDQLGGECLIRENTQKRQKVREDKSSSFSQQDEEKLISVRARIATLKEEMRKASECQKPLQQLEKLIKAEHRLLRAKIATLEEQLEFEYQNLCPRHSKELKYAKKDREEQTKLETLDSFSLRMMTSHSSETA